MTAKNSSPKEEISLKDNLKKLSDIAEWLESQEQSDEPDFESGLQKVKEAADLIKKSRERLTTITNEFEEIKKRLDDREQEPEPKDLPF